MISRKHRFHGYNSLRSVYQRGQTVRGPLIALKYLSNPRRSSYRLAVVVSKKVHKSAVKRNRIRRRLYEAFRNSAEDMLAPYDMVVTVFHEQITELTAPELSRLVRAQLKQAGIIAKTTSASSKNSGQKP